jgi:hypothetical protein
MSDKIISFPINVKHDDLLAILMEAVDDGGIILIWKLQEALDVIKNGRYEGWFSKKYIGERK